jgi:hypothetical protein
VLPLDPRISSPAESRVSGKGSAKSLTGPW